MFAIRCIVTVTAVAFFTAGESANAAWPYYNPYGPVYSIPTYAPPTFTMPSAYSPGANYALPGSTFVGGSPTPFGGWMQQRSWTGLDGLPHGVVTQYDTYGQPTSLTRYRPVYRANMIRP